MELLKEMKLFKARSQGREKMKLFKAHSMRNCSRHRENVTAQHTGKEIATEEMKLF